LIAVFDILLMHAPTIYTMASADSNARALQFIVGLYFRHEQLD